MNTLEQQAELYELWARTIRVCAKAGIEPRYKYRLIQYRHPDLSCDFEDYDFPVAVVEGKCVFVGDELYCTCTGKKFTVKGLCNSNLAFEYTTIFDGRACSSIDSCS